MLKELTTLKGKILMPRGVSQILNKERTISLRENSGSFLAKPFATEATVINDARYTYICMKISEITF